MANLGKLIDDASDSDFDLTGQRLRFREKEYVVRHEYRLLLAAYRHCIPHIGQSCRAITPMVRGPSQAEVSCA